MRCFVLVISVVAALNMAELVREPHRGVVPRIRPIVRIVLIVLIDRVELGLRGGAEVVGAVLVARACHRLVLVARVLVPCQNTCAPLRSALQVRIVLPLKLVYLVLLFLWVVLIGVHIACGANFLLAALPVLLLVVRRYTWRRHLLATEVPGRVY